MFAIEQQLLYLRFSKQSVTRNVALIVGRRKRTLLLCLLTIWMSVKRVSVYFNTSDTQLCVIWYTPRSVSRLVVDIEKTKGGHVDMVTDTDFVYSHIGHAKGAQFHTIHYLSSMQNCLHLTHACDGYSTQAFSSRCVNPVETSTS